MANKGNTDKANNVVVPISPFNKSNEQKKEPADWLEFAKDFYFIFTDDSSWIGSELVNMLNAFIIQLPDVIAEKSPERSIEARWLVSHFQILSAQCFEPKSEAWNYLISEAQEHLNELILLTEEEPKIIQFDQNTLFLPYSAYGLAAQLFWSTGNFEEAKTWTQHGLDNLDCFIAPEFTGVKKEIKNMLNRVKKQCLPGCDALLSIPLILEED